MAQRTVTDERKQFAAMTKRLATLATLDITVGIHGEDTRRDGGDGSVNNVAIGAIHEFGAPSVGVPKRSWLRSAIDKHQSAILDEMDGVVDAVAQGAQPMAQVKALGLQVVEVVREGIRSGINPPLSERMVERRRAKLSGGKPANKRFGAKETPLIDTGQLIQSIKAQVERRAS